MTTEDHDAAMAARDALEMTLLTAVNQLLKSVDKVQKTGRDILIAMTGIFIMQVGVMISLWAR